MKYVKYTEPGLIDVEASSDSVWILESSETVTLVMETLASVKAEIGRFVRDLQFYPRVEDCARSEIRVTLKEPCFETFTDAVESFLFASMVVTRSLQRKLEAIGIGLVLNPDNALPWVVQSGRLCFVIEPCPVLRLRAQHVAAKGEYECLLERSKKDLDVHLGDIAANTDDPTNFKMVANNIVDSIEGLANQDLPRLRAWEDRPVEDLFGLEESAEPSQRKIVRPQEDALALSKSLRKVADELERLAIVSQGF